MSDSHLSSHCVGTQQGHGAADSPVDRDAGQLPRGPLATHPHLLHSCLSHPHSHPPVSRESCVLGLIKYLDESCLSAELLRRQEEDDRRSEEDRHRRQEEEGASMSGRVKKRSRGNVTQGRQRAFHIIVTHFVSPCITCAIPTVSNLLT